MSSFSVVLRVWSKSSGGSRQRQIGGSQCFGFADRRWGRDGWRIEKMTVVRGPSAANKRWMEVTTTVIAAAFACQEKKKKNGKRNFLYFCWLRSSEAQAGMCHVETQLTGVSPRSHFGC